jgi:hypothetical protein
MSTVPDADRYLDMNVELVCPKCGTGGLIPWQRLDRALWCQRCSILFRVEANRLVELEESAHERISVQVRSSSSEWHDHKAVIEKAPSVAARLLAGALEVATHKYAPWAAVLGAILLIVGSLATATRKEARPLPLEMPMLLDERAILLAEALVRRDMEVLILLTDPSQHRALRIWLAHGKDLPRQMSNENEAPQIPSEVLSKAKTTAAGDSVDVRVRLCLPPDGKEFVLNERWVQQGTTWYFRPVRLRFAPPRVTSRAEQQRLHSGR